MDRIYYLKMIRKALPQMSSRCRKNTNLQGKLKASYFLSNCAMDPIGIW